MTDRHIIFIPGKNPKPPAQQHKRLLWRTLLEGVRRAEPSVEKEMLQYADAFQIIAWNYLYYREKKDISREIPWIDELMNKHGPTELDISEAKAWHRKFDQFVYSTIDRFPALLQLMTGTIRATAEETNRYFSNGNNIANEVRELLKKALRPMLENSDKVLLIGHSLGSVIVYDTLWELSHEENHQGKIDLFLTIGSPLGMNYVQSRLRGHELEGSEKYPTNIRRWVNLSSDGDVIALDREFKDDFSEMLEWGVVESIEDHCEGIYNFYRNEEGLNVHRSYGYLINPAVGKVIADWWQDSEQTDSVDTLLV